MLGRLRSGNSISKGANETIFIGIMGLVLFLAVLLLMTTLSDSAEGRVVVVDEQGEGNFTDVSHALFAADEGDVITIRSGNYSANYLWSGFRDNLTIKGDGSNSTRLVFSTSYSSIMVENSSVAFSGINFTSESSVSEGIGNQIFAYNGSGITFRDCTFHRISRVAIYYDAWNTTFENNSFIDSDLFFYVGSGEQISSSTILNNTYNRRPIHFLTDQNKPEIPKDQGGLTLINCTNVTIRDWEKTETSLGIKLYYCRNVIVENCTIRSLGYPIDIGVCDNVTITGCTVRSGPFTSIAYSWYSTNIRFHNNTFHESLYIMAGDLIQIADNTFRDEAGIIFYPTLNITILRNTFESGKINIWPTGSITNFEGHTIEIAGNTIQGLPILYYWDAKDVVIPETAAQVIMVGCTDMSLVASADSDQLRSIIIFRSHSVDISEFDLQPGGSISIYDSEAVDIINCSFTHASTGVKTDGSSDMIVANCTFMNSSLSSSRILGFRIEGCSFQGTEGSDKYGITIYGNVTIVDSIISGYDRGVYISGDKSLIDGCEILNNTFGIIFVSGEHTVRNCIIVQNSDQGIKVDDSFPGEDFDRPDISVDARYNYWGSVNGPYHPEENPSGWGDAVGDGVLFSPWHESRDFVPFEGSYGDGTDDNGDDPDVMGFILLVMVLCILFVVLAIFVLLPTPGRKL